ncbi:MAG: GGDEF domain-containing protein [Gaiellales bacterium]
MFRKREEIPGVASEAVRTEPAAMEALDTVAAILRALARVPSSRHGAAGELEAWARHVLVLAPPPRGRGWRNDRDWRGLQQHVVSHIREESVGVGRTIGDLQDALWAVIEGMSRVVAADAAEDARAAECLARLRGAPGAPVEEMKQTVLDAVEQLGSLVETKTARHQAIARELGERVDVLRVELDAARREAELDGLTKLANRVTLNRELSRALQLHVLTGEPYALVMVDIDGFKAVNDRFGHLAGDEALRSIADALALSFPRRADLVCRYGGDEFAIVLRDTSLGDAERLAARSLEAVRGLSMDGFEELALTVSVGVAAPGASDSSAGWIELADRALYAAKAGGRDRVAIAPDITGPEDAATDLRAA